VLKNILTTLLFCLLLIAGVVYAQQPLDNLPIQVGGYVYDQQNQPISDASVTFIDQTTLVEYQGLTDASGWYGNLGYSAVPDLPQTRVLGSAYPNPFGSQTSIEIRSDGSDKSSGFDEIKIFDVRGRKVGSIPAISGTHQVKTQSGQLPKGTYFYKLGNEVRKFVGSPKWISIKTTSDSAEKSMVEYQMIVSADGFVVSDELVSLDDSQTNYLNSILYSDQNPIQGTLFGDAWDLLGDSPLRGGELFIRNAQGELFSGSVDSSFSVDFNYLSGTDTLTAWFDHPDMSPNGVLFDQDGLAVRDRVEQAAAFVSPDTMTFSADNPYLSGAVRYKAVDQMWIDDPIWNGLLNGTHRTRGEDREEEDGAWRLEGLMNEYDQSQATFGDPVQPAVLEDIEFLINYKQGLLTGAQADGTVYGNVSAEMTANPAGGYGVGYLFVDTTTTPGNWPYNVDGYNEAYFSFFPYGTVLGTKAAEFFGEELTDYEGDLADALDTENLGYLNDRGRAAFNAHYLFDDGVDFVPSSKMAPVRR